MIPEFVKQNFKSVPRLVKTSWQYIYIRDAWILLKSVCEMGLISTLSLLPSTQTEYVHSLLMKAVDVKLTTHNFYWKGKQNLEENTFKLMIFKRMNKFFALGFYWLW